MSIRKRKRGKGYQCPVGEGFQIALRGRGPPQILENYENRIAYVERKSVLVSPPVNSQDNSSLILLSEAKQNISLEERAGVGEAGVITSWG